MSVKIKTQEYPDLQVLAKKLGLITKLPESLEKEIWKVLLEHNKDDESLNETFGRIVALAELQMETQSVKKQVNCN